MDDFIQGKGKEAWVGSHQPLPGGETSSSVIRRTVLIPIIAPLRRKEPGFLITSWNLPAFLQLAENKCFSPVPPGNSRWRFFR